MFEMNSWILLFVVLFSTTFRFGRSAPDDLNGGNSSTEGIPQLQNNDNSSNSYTYKCDNFNVYKQGPWAGSFCSDGVDFTCNAYVATCGQQEIEYCRHTFYPNNINGHERTTCIAKMKCADGEWTKMECSGIGIWTGLYLVGDSCCKDNQPCTCGTSATTTPAITTTVPVTTTSTPANTTTVPATTTSTPANTTTVPATTTSTPANTTTVPATTTSTPANTTTVPATTTTVPANTTTTPATTTTTPATTTTVPATTTTTPANTTTDPATTTIVHTTTGTTSRGFGDPGPTPTPTPSTPCVCVDPVSTVKDLINWSALTPSVRVKQTKEGDCGIYKIFCTCGYQPVVFSNITNQDEYKTVADACVGVELLCDPVYAKDWVMKISTCTEQFIVPVTTFSNTWRVRCEKCNGCNCPGNNGYQCAGGCN